MHIAEITIEWSESADGSPCYRANGETLGCGDQGFDALLELIRNNPRAAVTLKPPDTPLGGQDLAGSVPFANRFSDLVAALGGRSLGWDLL